MNLILSKPTENRNFAIVTTLAVLLFSFLMANKAIAKPNIDVGPVIGKEAPQITVLDESNNMVDIKALSKNKGVILLFFRSADWCPFCKRHLIELNVQAEKFTKLGYGLAGISYDSREILNAFTQAQNISYPLLSDQEVATMKAYNIVNTQYKPSDDNYGIPYPGVVVIDNQGKVIHKYFYEGYRDRVKFNELYNQLK